MRGLFLFIFVVLLLVASSSANACYTDREIEAEQGVRIHSELMVIGLTCKAFSGGSQRFNQYQNFSNRHADLISFYEENLISYYAKEGFSNPEQKLHELRTTMANDISEHAVTMSVMSFCNSFGDRIDKASMMDRSGVREWANYMWRKGVLSEPVCGG